MSASSPTAAGNEEETRKDAYGREAIVTALRTALTQGDKALVGNKGYRRFLEGQGTRFTIDDTIRGHVCCSFLALLLRQDLQRRLTAKHWTLEWATVVADLDALHETTVTIKTRAFVVRSEAKRTMGKVFQACGAALPPAPRPA
jgi:hypothetical protein